jgi:sugar (glycoside-pentoside-hexuronide) transporter
MKISIREKAAHAIGGVGHNLIYALFSGYLLIFYTDVFNLDSAFTGTLFLIARIWDAVNDPMFGALMDKTHSKWGRYRPWMAVAAPLVGVSLVLCFIVPDFSKTLQYVYCYVTYILLGMAFTCVDIPYWTLPSVMTDEPEERSKVFSISTIVAGLASGIGAVLVPLIYNSLGKKEGLLISAIIFAVIGLICYYIVIFLVKERVNVTSSRSSLKTALKAIFTNKPLLIIMAASLFGNFAFQLKAALFAYYGKYTLGGNTADYTMYLSIMLLIGMIIGSALVPMMIKKFGAKKAMASTLLSGAVISTVYWLVGYSNLIVVLIFNALAAIVIGCFSVLVNSMTSDTIDYAELKQGERNEGIITSTRTFITKLATAVAGALLAYLLDPLGYVENQVQTAAVNDAFHRLMSLYPAIIYLAAFLVIIFYPLDEEHFAQMESELKEKRNSSCLKK